MGISGLLVKGDGANLTLTESAGDDAFAGSTAGEVFYTGLGDDQVYASGGSDKVYADFGNDWLHGGSGVDVISFQYVNNLDSVTRDPTPIGVTFDLEKSVHNLGILGTKTTFGFESVEGTSFKDKLYGNDQANELIGWEGNDLLTGRGGKDSLQGVSGSDTLIGGKGADEMAGSVIGVLLDDHDKDVFRYMATNQSGTTTSTRDTIWGTFNGGGTGGDKIDPSAIDANGSASGNGTFKFLGRAPFHANSNGEIRVTSAGTNLYLVQIDVDTDALAEMTILVRSNTALVKGDFVL